MLAVPEVRLVKTAVSAVSKEEKNPVVLVLFVVEALVATRLVVVALVAFRSVIVPEAAVKSVTVPFVIVVVAN